MKSLSRSEFCDQTKEWTIYNKHFFSRYTTIGKHLNSFVASNLKVANFSMNWLVKIGGKKIVTDHQNLLNVWVIVLG